MISAIPSGLLFAHPSRTRGASLDSRLSRVISFRLLSIASTKTSSRDENLILARTRARGYELRTTESSHMKYSYTVSLALCSPRFQISPARKIALNCKLPICAEADDVPAIERPSILSRYPHSPETRKMSDRNRDHQERKREKKWSGKTTIHRVI